jgi:signal transduction histidine kinase/ligand-binding sensor domain-containing protein/CheY-like chemotaxis protein
MRLCLLLGLLLCCSSASAGLPETPQFRQMTVADGLPSSALYAVVQDKKGYLWIASKDGLARYDGIAYKIYRYAPGDENALPGNVVQALYVDKKDQLWIAMEGQGLSRLNAERTDFVHFRKSTHPEITSDDIWAITSTIDGDLWFGTYGGGLNRMAADGKIKRFMPEKNDPHSLPSDTVLSLATDSKGRLWIGTTKGLCLWDGQKFTTITTNSVLNIFIMQLIGDTDGSIWAGTRKGLVHLSAQGQQIGDVFAAGKMITGLWQDKQGAVWFSDGPNIFQWRDRQLLSYTPDSQTPAKIYGVFEDHEGGFWFPTEDRGMLRLPAGWRNFSVFRHQEEGESLSGMAVLATAEANQNEAWVVSLGGGLDKINLSKGDVEPVLRDIKTWTQRLWSVLQTRDGIVWLGHSNGLASFNPTDGVLRRSASGVGGQHALPGAVRLLIQTKNGLLWSASYGGGIQARDETGRIVHSIVPGDGKGLMSADPDQFALSPEGELWLATAQGLLRWDDEGAKFIAIEGGPAERVDAFSFRATDIVWVHRIGVLEAFQWNGRKLKSLRRVTGDDGLPPVEVGSILPDRSGNLWLTTTRGLLRYNVSTNEFRMFGERDGLPSQEFDMQPALLTSGGLALVGTAKGLVIFDPIKIRNQSVLSPLVLDGLSLRRGEDMINFPSTTSAIDLQSYDRDLTINLRLLSFADASTHRYRFLLKGYDRDWVDAGGSGARVFTSLPAGNYQLEAKAADAEGRWSKSLKLKLVVHPPWWKTSWAKILWATLFMLTLLAIALLYRRRLKLRHNQRMRDQEREIAQQNSAAKSRFLATLGHEIRTPMTGVLGMAELLQADDLSLQQKHRVAAIQSAGQHLLRLMNDVLDLAQIEAGKLRLHDEAFDVNALILEIFELLKPLADMKGLSISCIMDKDTPKFCIGDAGRVRQILLNLGNNAIKFTRQGHVIIRAAGTIPFGLQLQVSDTGPGMSDEQQTRLFQRFEQAEGSRTNQQYGGSGLGLAICQELSVAMNGNIAVESSLGQGALFVVELPLRTAQVSALTDAPKSQSIIENAFLKVLLVEDEPLVAEVLVDLLQAMGHQVSHTQQGMQALSELAVKSFDIVLVDLDLPGIDGLELARLIQTQGHNLPIVAITARADSQAEPAALAAGMVAFIRKPASTADLQKLFQILAITGRSV